MGRFTKQVVVITGGASGIGEATARAIVEHGGRVVIADLQQEKGAALADELGTAAIFRFFTGRRDYSACGTAHGRSLIANQGLRRLSP